MTPQPNAGDDDGGAGTHAPMADAGGSDCAVGSEGCACTRGGACDPGLACGASNRCVDLGAAGRSAGSDGGTAGMGAAGAGAGGKGPMQMATAIAAIEPFGMGWGSDGGMAGAFGNPGTAGMGTPSGAAGSTGTGMPMSAGMAGYATFSQDGTDVLVQVTLYNCPDGVHGVHIHQGTSCDTAETQGAHWDMTRGEGIPDVPCSGGTGSTMNWRSATPPETAWSVGGDAATDVVGHALVVHGEGMPPERIACGVIML